LLTTLGSLVAVGSAGAVTVLTVPPTVMVVTDGGGDSDTLSLVLV
jgi:hypothetical protein